MRKNWPLANDKSEMEALALKKHIISLLCSRTQRRSEKKHANFVEWCFFYCMHFKFIQKYPNKLEMRKTRVDYCDIDVLFCNYE